MIDRLGFRNNAQKEKEEERLVQLFQNRAGLKKAHADLQDELHLLRDRLKQQEGATIRVQEQLDQLGDLLGNPVAGFGALVYFQLRSLWKTCHAQLAEFAADLTKQQEARESAKHNADVLSARDERLADVSGRFAEAAAQADAERSSLAQMQAKLAASTAIWHYFKRRKLHRACDTQRARVAAADALVGDLHAEKSAVESESVPDFPGISLEARRTINLAIIGYSEMLYERLVPSGLAARAKEVLARRVHEMSFGSRSECEALMGELQKGIATAKSDREVAATVKSKIERYRARCTYRTSSDTVPTADSVADAGIDDVLRRGKASRATSGNVLAEDYWDLYTLLLR